MKKHTEGGEIVQQIEEGIRMEIQKPSEPKTAYQLFIIEKKQEGKFSLTEFGQMWSGLQMDYKEKFQQLAREDKERYEKEMEIYRSSNPEMESFFPLSRLKHILSMDEERRKISKDGYMAILKATELFGELLGKQVKEKVKKDGKKLVMEEDLFTIIKEVQELQFLDCLTQHATKKKTQKKKLEEMK